MTKFRLTPQFQSTGLQAGFHSKRLFNQPGKRNLNFQLGDTEDFFEEMKERLRRTTDIGELLPTDTGRLADLVTDPTTDWAAALMRSWAVIGNILSFYQERLINEGYIGTATQPRSFELLDAMLGLNRGASERLPNGLVSGFRIPGIAGSANVIAQVREGKGLPKITTLPANSSVRRVGPSQKNTNFFVVEQDTEIRSEWNSLTVVPSLTAEKDHRPNFTPGVGAIFQGRLHRPVAGDKIAITGLCLGQPIWCLQEISSVRYDEKNKQTTIIWKEQARIPTNADISNGIVSPRFFIFDQKAKPFGSTARDLTNEPVGVRKNYIASGGIELWPAVGKSPATTPTNPIERFDSNLPESYINDLAVCDNGTLLLATPRGVYVRQADQTSWFQSKQGLTNTAVQSITLDSNDLIYVTTAGGGVYRNIEATAPWSRVSGKYRRPNEKSKGGGTALPATTVYKVAVGANIIPLTASGETTNQLPDTLIVTATDSGLYQNYQRGAGWFTIPTSGKASSKKTDSGGHLHSSDPVLDCALVSHFQQTYIVTIVGKSLIVLSLPDKKTQASNNSTSKISPSTGKNRLGQLPGLFGVLSAVSSKSGRLLKSLFVGLVKLPWHTLFTAYKLAKKLLEKVTGVDKIKWAETALPYPGSDVPFTGDFISMALFESQKKTWVCLSSGDGIFIYAPNEGKLVSWTQGLPMNHPGFGNLTPCDAEHYNGAVILTVMGGNIYGFVPDTTVAASEMLSGEWQLLVSSARPADKATAGIEYPNIVRPYPGGDFVTAQPAVFKDQWPGFEFGDDEAGLKKLDVTNIRDKLTGGTTGVLVSNTNAAVCPFTVKSSISLVRTDFGIREAVIRLLVTPDFTPFNPHAFDRRTATVLLGTEEIFTAEKSSASLQTVNRSNVTFSGIVQDLSDRPLSIQGKSARVLPLPIGGIQSWSFVGNRATPLGRPSLPIHSITSLNELENENILALSDKGAWLWDPLDDWQPSNEGLAKDDRICIQAGLTAHKETWMLTSKHLYKRSSNQGAWQKQSGPTTDAPLSCFLEIPAATSSHQASILLIGTQGDGLFYSSDLGDWTQVYSSSLPVNASVTSLVTGQRGSLFIGTDGSGLLIADSALAIKRVAPELDALQSISLMRQKNADIIISNNVGDLYRITTTARTAVITPLSASPGNQTILDLVIKENIWIIGTNGGGVARSTDDGHTWHQLNTGVCNRAQALLLYQDHWLVAAAPETLLTGPGGENQRQVKPTLVFTLPAKIYIKQLDGQLISRGMVDAFKSAKVKLPEIPVIEVLASGQRWLLKEAVHSPTSTISKQSFVIYRDKQKLLVCENQPALSILNALPNNHDDGMEYSVSLDVGVTAYFNAHVAEVAYMPSLKNDPLVSLVETIERSEIDAPNSVTKVKVAKPTTKILEASTTHFSSNVVSLCQGHFYKNQVLGNGNTAIPFQHFTIKTGPLVFVHESATIIVPVLKVYVEDIEYRQIENMADAGPHDRVYVLTLSYKGLATITFGDGKTGTALPTGEGNVTATYRAGMPVFNVNERKAFYIFDHPPYGVATTALTATQIAPTPPVGGQKNTAPESDYNLLPHRLVTPADFRKLAASIPSIGKSKLDIIHLKGRKTICLTLATNEPKQLHANSTILTATRETIGRISLAPEMPLLLLPACLKPFVVKSQIALEPMFPEQDFETLLLQASQVITEKFSFSMATIGKTVTPQMIVQSIFSITGVAGTKVNTLNIVGDAAGIGPLEAKKVDPEALSGAEIFFLSTRAQSSSISIVDASGRILKELCFPLLQLDEEPQCD